MKVIVRSVPPCECVIDNSDQRNGTKLVLCLPCSIRREYREGLREIVRVAEMDDGPIVIDVETGGPRQQVIRIAKDLLAKGESK